MKLLFNDSTYNVKSVDDALDIIDEYCVEYNMHYDESHDDNGDSVYLHEQGMPRVDSQGQLSSWR